MILLAMFFSALAMNAQIEMFDETAQKAEEPQAIPYDSLSNMKTQPFGIKGKCKYTFDHLIGQTLLYCGNPYDYYGRSAFKTGKYYKVIGTLPDDVGKGLYTRMSLEDVETKERMNEGGLTGTRFNAWWVVVGYYEKMKKLYQDKQFIYLGTKDVFVHYSWKKANGLINLETDTVTKNVKVGSCWTCTGVQVKPRKKDDDMELDWRSPVVLIFDNPTYGKHYCYLEADDGKPYLMLKDDTKPYVCGRFQLKSDYDRMIAENAANKAKRRANLTKRFGTANAKLIMEGVVKIGMSKAMCRESWGEPDDINKSIGSWGNHEQWVYGSSYLYFEGNKLTAIQN